MKTTVSQGGADTVPRSPAHRHPFPRSRWNDKPRPDTKLDTAPPCLSLAHASSLLVSSTATTLPHAVAPENRLRERTERLWRGTQWRRQLRIRVRRTEHFKLVAWTAAFFGVLLCHRGNECIGDVGERVMPNVARRSNHCSFGEVIMLDRRG